MIKELDIVALTRAVPAHGLVAGDIGTVVMLHAPVPGHGAGVTVEFTTQAGKTIAIETLPIESIRSIGPRDMAHVREIADAAE